MYIILYDKTYTKNYSHEDSGNALQWRRVEIASTKEEANMFLNYLQKNNYVASTDLRVYKTDGNIIETIKEKYYDYIEY